MKLIPTAALLVAAIPAVGQAQTATTAGRAGSAAAPATAAPVTPPPRTDANCLLVSNIFAQQSTDATQKAQAGTVLFYYFGRIDARTSEAQLKTELRQAGSAQFTPQTAAALMNSCVQNMQSRTQVLENVSKQLQQGK